MMVLLISVYYRVRFMIVWHLDEKNLCCPPKKKIPTECDSLDAALCMESNENRTVFLDKQATLTNVSTENG